MLSNKSIEEKWNICLIKVTIKMKLFVHFIIFFNVKCR